MSTLGRISTSCCRPNPPGASRQRRAFFIKKKGAWGIAPNGVRGDSPGRLFRSLAILILALLVRVAPAQADLYGLVIGIDEYQHVNPLDGAVNDAKDIAQALGRLKPKDVRLLLNAQADRDSIFAAWKAITAEAKPGDTVFLTFAGHGAQVPVPGQNRLQQFVVLPGFAFKGEGTYQRILDAEFGQMLRAVPKLNVVFVADSCHAGTMTRAYAAKPKFKTRSVTTPLLEDDRLAGLSHGTTAEAGDVVLPNVAHLGAVPPDELDPEIEINNQPRGALSFAVARALDGSADVNHDGVLRGREMESYVGEVVRTRTDGQQHPQIAIRDDFKLPLRDVSEKPAPPPPAPPPQDVTPGLKLAIVNAGPADLPSLVRQLKGVHLVPEDQATLTWDGKRGVITSRFGDVVSYGAAASSSGGDPLADLQRVQRVVDKMLLVDTIKAAAQKNVLQVALVPDDKLHRTGQQLAFTVSGQRSGYLTLFNLSSDGTINFL
ncbi:MAG: caspase family protein, partial [Alphaproteobacteria bacterium]|nr:caspase family protein [Alphaproteobacteria bacterium]